MRAVIDRESQVCLYSYLVPCVFINERLERLGAAFDDERLYTMGVQALQIQRVLSVDYQSLGIGPLPLPDIQLRVFTLVGDAPYENGVFLGPEFV